MLSFLRPKKGKSSRGQSYYDRENMVHTINDFDSIINPQINKQYITTNTVKYIGLALSEINERKVLEAFNNPTYISENLNDHKVLFFRHSIDTFIFLMQFHFYKKSFVFVSNMVTSSGLLSKSDKVTFINRITQKYFSDLKLDFQQGFNIKITDKVNNFIKIDDGVTFRINYVNNSSVNQQIVNNPKYSNEIIKIDFDSKIDEYF